MCLLRTEIGLVINVAEKIIQYEELPKNQSCSIKRKKKRLSFGGIEFPVKGDSPEGSHGLLG